MAPVPLSIFRSNSKFDENLERSSFEYTGPITTIFCTRHDSGTEFSSNFEFDRNMLSGSGAWCSLECSFSRNNVDNH